MDSERNDQIFTETGTQEMLGVQHRCTPDFREIYDSVDQTALYRIMRKLRIPGKLDTTNKNDDDDRR